MKTPTISKKIKQILISTVLLSLVGCGGSGVVSNTRIGQLTGSHAINNLHYVTKTHSGNTNSEGEFVDEPGESIRFYDGTLLIGKAKAADVIESLTLEGMTLSVKR